MLWMGYMVNWLFHGALDRFHSAMGEVYSAMCRSSLVLWVDPMDSILQYYWCYG